MIIIIILLTVKRSAQLIEPASYILLQVPAQINKMTILFARCENSCSPKSFKYTLWLQAQAHIWKLYVAIKLLHIFQEKKSQHFTQLQQKKKTRKYAFKYLENRACWIHFHGLSTCIRTKNNDTLAGRHVGSVMRSAFFAQRHQSSSSMRPSREMRAKNIFTITV